MSKLAVIRLFAAVALLSAATSAILVTGLSSPAPASASVRRADAPTATLRASTERIGWTGGSLSLTAVVRNGKSCQFFSVPAVSGIDGTVACGLGKVTRKGKVPPYTNGRPVQFELVVSGADGLKATELTVRQLARPAPSAKSYVVFRQSGNGPATTSAFAIPGNAVWTVDWSYGNCSLGGDFNFDVYSGNLPDLNDAGPLDLNASGAGSDMYFDSGVYYFQVLTSCQWSMEVVDLVVPVTPSSTTSNVSATLSSSVTKVDASGGPITLTAHVHNGQLCTFLSDPAIAGLDGKSRCGSGGVTRQGQVPTYTEMRTIYVEVVVAGATGLKAAGTSIIQLAPPPVTTTTTPRSPQTLLNATGSGSSTTATFVIPTTDTQWSVTWSADCTSQVDGFGYFDYTVTNSTDYDSEFEAVTNTASQTNTFYDTGTFSLSISASCNWTVNVSG